MGHRWAKHAYKERRLSWSNSVVHLHNKSNDRAISRHWWISWVVCFVCLAFDKQATPTNRGRSVDRKEALGIYYLTAVSKSSDNVNWLNEVVDSRWKKRRRVWGRINERRMKGISKERIKWIREVGEEGVRRKKRKEENEEERKSEIWKKWSKQVEKMRRNEWRKDGKMKDKKN